MSGGHNKSDSSSQQTSFADPAQAPFLDALRQQGLNLQQQQVGSGIGSQDFFNQAINPLQQQGQQGLDQLGGIISGTNAQQQALQTAGQQGNPFTDALVEQTQGDIQRNLSNNILPSIGSASELAGQRGSSRQGIAEGLAAQDAQRLSSEASTNIRGQAFGQQLGANQAALGNQQTAISQLFPSLGGQLGLSQSQVSSPFMNLQNLQGLIGPVNNLGQGTSDSKSFGMHGGMMG